MHCGGWPSLLPWLIVRYMAADDASFTMELLAGLGYSIFPRPELSVASAITG